MMMCRPPGRCGSTLLDDPRARHLPDELQAAAARPDGRLTIITGAAGSGKSIALAERVALTVVAHPRTEPDPRVLVTAFNRGMIDLLAKWVHRALTDEGVPTTCRTREKATTRSKPP
jgi:hypothetical protein